jgi:AcrR family transcriptional regulator
LQDDSADAPLDESASPMRKRGRPKTRSDDDQRALIAAQSLDLFVKQGYGATSMDEVASRCHVSKRTLYRLFPRKIDLFSTLVDNHLSMMLSFPEPDPDRSLQEELALVFRVDLEPELEERHVAFIQIAVIEAQQFPELDEVFQKRGMAIARDHFSQWLASRKALGIVAVDSPRETGEIIVDMVFGALSKRFNNAHARACGRITATRQERLEYIQRCINLIAVGLRPR